MMLTFRLSLTVSALPFSSSCSNWCWHQINNFTFLVLLYICGSLAHLVLSGRGRTVETDGVPLVPRRKWTKREKTGGKRLKDREKGYHMGPVWSVCVSIMASNSDKQLSSQWPLAPMDLYVSRLACRYWARRVLAFMFFFFMCGSAGVQNVHWRWATG